MGEKIMMFSHRHYIKNIIFTFLYIVCLFSSIYSFSIEAASTGADKLTTIKDTQRVARENNDPLGWALPIVSIPDMAEQAYRQGLSEIGIGKTASAQSYFMSALKIAPYFDEARFQNARALALSSHVVAALEELTLLMQRDLPGYLEKIKHDSAFNILKNKMGGADFNLLVSTLESRWQAELKKGWPVVYFRRSQINESSEPQEYYNKHIIRSGIYIPQTQHFLPIGRSTKNALAVWGNRDKQAVLSVQADATVDIFSQLYNINWQLHPMFFSKKIEPKINVPIESDSSFYAMDFSFNANSLNLVTVEESEALGSVPDETHSSTVLRVLGEGSILLSTQPGYRISGDVLIMADSQKIPLNAGHENAQHQSIISYEKGVFVVSSQHTCDYSNPELPAVPFQHHIVDFVQPKTHKVERVSEGPGVASVIITHSGKALLQIGEQLDLLSQKGGGWEKRLLSNNMLIHVPLLNKHCVYQ